MNSDIVAIPKRTVFGRKHIVWAIKCENLSTGLTWVHAREKIQYNQEKLQNRNILQLSAEKPAERI